MAIGYIIIFTMNLYQYYIHSLCKIYINEKSSH